MTPFYGFLCLSVHTFNGDTPLPIFHMVKLRLWEMRSCTQTYTQHLLCTPLSSLGPQE